MAASQGTIERRRPARRQPDWRRRLPELSDGSVLLRPLRQRDAPALLAHLHKPGVLRHVAACPSTVDQFRQFIRWTHTERERGRHACYGMVPPGEENAVGIIQVWSVEQDFATAEWGFVLGESYWGKGLFMRSARLLLDAIFLDGLLGSPGVLRLEARSVQANARGNSVLCKPGATAEGLLRAGFRKGDTVADQIMWSILAPEWLAHRDAVMGGTGAARRHA
jgi:RimJ/RimL family protein N-acetyltransferase